MLDQYLTTDEAAEQAGLDAGYITRLLREGKLKGQRVRREWLVEKASLEAFKASVRKPGPKGRRMAHNTISPDIAPWAEIVPDAPYPMSQEEFERRYNGEKGVELVDGRVVREVGNTMLHMLVSRRLLRALDDYAQHSGAFQAFGADGSYKLHIAGEQRATTLEPDASLVQTARLPALNNLLAWDQILDLAPDLAAEIASEGQTSEKMEKKARRFLAAGTRLIWLVYPLERRGEIWRPGASAAIRLGYADAFDGYDVAPGLQVPLRQLV